MENILIIYDLKKGKDYERIKRKFYYYLNKLEFVRLTESALLMSNDELNKMIELLDQKGVLKYLKMYVIEYKKIVEL